MCLSTNTVISLFLVIGACGARTFHSGTFSFDDEHEVSTSGNQVYLNDGPPPHTEYAKVARYLVHRSDWTAMGTNSKAHPGFPMVNTISIADSPRREKSTGNIYFYLTDLDFTGQDLTADNKLTMLLSQEQDLYCSKNNIDAMEPICSRVIISGKIQKLENDTQEYKYAQQSMVSRHPASKKWVVTHDFYLCKLIIQNIALLDFYGGPHHVTTTDYYNANYDWNDSDEWHSENSEDLSKKQFEKVLERENIQNAKTKIDIIENNDSEVVVIHLKK